MPPDRPKPPAVGGPLDQVNEAFHAAYDAARDDVARSTPVIIVLADSLIVFQGEERRELAVSPRLFHIIKSVAHAPLALFGALRPLGEGPVEGAARERLQALQQWIIAAQDSLAADAPDPAIRSALAPVLGSSLALILDVLSAGHASAAALETFARATGPALLALTDHATRIQLAALHACVGEALAPMDAAARRALQVVVTGDHQARVRSLGMQYFRKLLREPEGTEERVTYAEGVTEEAEARALVGKRELDRAIATSFFGDPARLQRDVLGDAGRDRLSELDLPPIV